MMNREYSHPRRRSYSIQYVVLGPHMKRRRRGKGIVNNQYEIRAYLQEE